MRIFLVSILVFVLSAFFVQGQPWAEPGTNVLHEWEALGKKYINGSDKLIAKGGVHLTWGQRDLYFPVLVGQDWIIPEVTGAIPAPRALTSMGYPYNLFYDVNSPNSVDHRFFTYQSNGIEVIAFVGNAVGSNGLNWVHHVFQYKGSWYYIETGSHNNSLGIVPLVGNNHPITMGIFEAGRMMPRDFYAWYIRPVVLCNQLLNQISGEEDCCECCPWNYLCNCYYCIDKNGGDTTSLGDDKSVAYGWNDGCTCTACECGACCVCRCSCGKWFDFPNVRGGCSMQCPHDCWGCNNGNPCKSNTSSCCKCHCEEGCKDDGNDNGGVGDFIIVFENEPGLPELITVGLLPYNFELQTVDIPALSSPRANSYLSLRYWNRLKDLSFRVKGKSVCVDLSLMTSAKRTEKKLNGVS